jgi:itaconate CoA-transferase
VSPHDPAAAARPDPAGPLAGLRVVAVEQAVAGPLCSRHLADLGADVVKVERPGSGDFARRYDTLAHGEATHFVWLNRGKRSVALDLKAPDGRAALRALLGTADVLVSNLGTGALERIVDLDEVRQANPGLVSCAISGYGPDGPYARKKAFDLLVVGEAGVTLSTGTPDSPAKPGVSMADLAGGVYAMAAITAALLERTRTGTGRHVDVSLFDVMAEWMTPLLMAEELSGASVPPAGMHHATITPYGPYRSADGAQVNIAVQNDAQWQRLCRLVLHDDALADDPAYATNEGRLQRRTACEAAVAAGIGALGLAALERALDDADVPWGRLRTAGEVLTHPQLEQTGRWTSARLPSGASVRVVADPFRYRDRAVPSGRQVPAVGAHTAEVLAELDGSPRAASAP